MTYSFVMPCFVLHKTDIMDYLPNTDSDCICSAVVIDFASDVPDPRCDIANP